METAVPDTATSFFGIAGRILRIASTIHGETHPGLDCPLLDHNFTQDLSVQLTVLFKQMDVATVTDVREDTIFQG